ncbi:MAG: 50S ribosomal protein L17 [Phycisphaerales bacterium]
MRHQIYGKQLNRDSEHRRAMLRNLAAGLFEHGEIRTTMAKARAVQPFVEKIITTAKKGGLHARRQIEARINDRFIFAWLADPNVKEERKTNPWFDLPETEQIRFNRYGDLKKAPRLVQHIMTTIAPLFADRNGGYTRIIKLDEHRLGDGTDYVLLQLVGIEDGPEISGRRSTRRATADRRTAFAAKLRKSGAGKEKAEEAEATAAVAEVEPTEESEDLQ